MRYLIIDTCTERGVMGYGSKDDILFEQALPFGLNQSKFLLPALMEALKPFGPFPELTAIGVGMGPGSYTGIRIGAAIAQALAYSWNVPLIGIPCLEGFSTSEPSAPFAAILDARIGGIYFQKGETILNEVHYVGEAQVSLLEDAGNHLEGIAHFVSPSVKSLQEKLSKIYPNKKWLWEERAPSVKMLLQNIERKHSKGEMVIPPQHLDLLYLRQTEAEREKLSQKGRPCLPFQSISIEKD